MTLSTLSYETVVIERFYDPPRDPVSTTKPSTTFQGVPHVTRSCSQLCRLA